VVDEGDTVIESPVPMEPLWAEFGYHTQEAPAPSDPPDKVSVLEIPEQIVAPPDNEIPVGGVDAPGDPVQLRHCVPLLQTPDAHFTAA
jgi:hypothetical protein